MIKVSQYCPVCGRDIEPCNVKEVESGEHSGYIFLHDDVIHTEDDLEALQAGVQ